MSVAWIRRIVTWLFGRDGNRCRRWVGRVGWIVVVRLRLSGHCGSSTVAECVKKSVWDGPDEDNVCRM